MTGFSWEGPLGNRSIDEAEFMWKHIHGFIVASI